MITHTLELIVFLISVRLVVAGKSRIYNTYCHLQKLNFVEKGKTDFQLVKWRLHLKPNEL